MIDYIVSNFASFADDYTHCLVVIYIICVSFLLSVWLKPFVQVRKAAFLTTIIYFVFRFIYYLIPIDNDFLRGISLGIIPVIFLASWLLDNKRNPVQKLFLSILYYLISWLTYEISVEIGLFEREIMDKFEWYHSDAKAIATEFIIWNLIEYAFAVAILYISVRLIQKAYIRKMEELSWKELLMLLAPFWTILLVKPIMLAYFTLWMDGIANGSIQENIPSSIYRLVFCVLSLLSVIVIITLYQRIKEATDDKYARQSLENQTEDIRRHMGQIEDMYEKIRAMRHDMGNHMAVIEGLADKGEKNALSEYIGQWKKSYDGQPWVKNLSRPYTANDGLEGERLLKEFQDNEKTIPTVLTTSQKLSTGVDALNIRNIVLLRPIHSMIEFKQIIGRGTRLYDGKYYFTIYDFVKAYENFQDPTWDGEPVLTPSDVVDGYIIELKNVSAELHESDHPGYGPKVCPKCGQDPCICEKPEKLEIRLSDGRARRIKYLKSDMFWGSDGKPVSAEEFLNAMFGQLPNFFSSIEDLQEKWSNPKTREELLAQMDAAGYGKEVLKQIRTLLDAEDCDLLDVLEYISFNIEPIQRTERVKKVDAFRASLGANGQDFVNYIIQLYIKEGIDELSADKLPAIISMKYGSIPDGMKVLGGVDKARGLFLDFQKNLYLNNAVAS